ncbi:hypothetical protein [Chryseobacterium sp. 2987]|uniref:hypothetical protein n=1 Tax=Chryseobacterium sp. 2987 TaxID=2817767 RepID=UPI002864BE4C|nr:hypothetical protein [Chryseobacterium sp. 2987]MDR6923960.1 hypothetical protein [Chryseobacterium sp. 2987]
MKNKLFLSIITIFTLLSCQKKHQVKASDNDLNAILTLSNYKTSQKTINDSIIEISGYNEKFTIQGKYNKNSKHKIGWWDIHYKMNDQKYFNVEFFLEDNIERKNQIIFYHQNKIDTSKSKLYTTNFKYENNKISKVIYHFYTPKSDFITKNVDLIYDITTDTKDSEPQKIALNIHNNSHHYCEIDLTKYKNSKSIIVGGLFSEYSSNKAKTEMGVNDIFIHDTIQVTKEF